MNDQLLQELNSFRDWVRWVSSEFERAELFYGHGSDNSWDEALWLVLWAIKQPWGRLEWVMDARLAQSEKSTILDLARQRITTRKPLAYLTGEAWFAGERFIVSEDTLVPRSPIAELIASEFAPWLQEHPERILDMCTGSGCIGIICAKQFVDAQVDLVDISPEALAVADQNIALHELASRVVAKCSDGFTALDSARYDVIVSNPPYVSEYEYAQLEDEYKAEPKLGLTSGEDGFDFTEMLLREAANYLNPNGLLIVEVGHGWHGLQEKHPHVPFMWPEFEHGGDGIFILSREQLIAFRD